MSSLVPGFRFFTCSECGEVYSVTTRDCHSPSLEICPNCNKENVPLYLEEHPEWPTDKTGNLKK